MEDNLKNHEDIQSESKKVISLPQEKNSLCKKCKNALKKTFTWPVIKPILCGQGLSFLICGTAISSEYLQRANVSIPLTQSFINYIFLGLVYTTLLCFRKNADGTSVIKTTLKKYWWKYLLIAAVDVEANFLVVKAYEFTSLTSVQLLDCFILPVVMILSYFLMKIRYLWVHFVGVVIALVGVGCMVGADVLVGQDGTGEAGSNPALGDVLVLSGAVLYGISNVTMEYVSKKHAAGNLEILAMFGLFCPIICGIQMAILEREALASIEWNLSIVGLLALFGTCMFLLYSLMPLVMRLSSACTVNISLLTADLYALFAGLFLFNDKMSVLYVVSFATIVVALITYNSRQPVSRRSEDASRESSCRDTDELSHLSEARGTWFSSQPNQNLVNEVNRA